MTARELMSRYAMADHVENGQFVELHYAHVGEGRPASGSMFYYVAPGEKTEFHRIDCDEYWCYIAGETLELWQYDEAGELTVSRLGVTEGAEPLVFFRSGMTFASRSAKNAADGTFLTCITVPRFHYEGFEMFTEAQVLAACPAAEAFFRDE